MEEGVYKIRVNSISPALSKSEIMQGLMQKDCLRNVARKTVPSRTFGTADPASTSLVRYLIHDSSEYVTGTNFIVDAIKNQFQIYKKSGSDLQQHPSLESCLVN